MAEIRPFVSIRPQRGKAAEIAALPYDVYNREEATKEVERHPQSFLSIDRAETQFPLSVDMLTTRCMSVHMIHSGNGWRTARF